MHLVSYLEIFRHNANQLWIFAQTSLSFVHLFRTWITIDCSSRSKDDTMEVT
jgi:hypothetical protein